MYGIIYKATNLINGKCYIGQTKNSLKRRIQAHIYETVSNKRKKYYFQRAILKYTPAAFSWEVLCQCDSLEELNDMEFHYIQQYKAYVHFKNSNGYNLTFGGDGILGHIYTIEQKENMSKVQLKIWQNEEYKERMKEVYESKERKENFSKCMLELWQNEEYKERMKEIFSSQEYKEKRSKNMKNLWQNEEYKEKRSKNMKNLWQNEELRIKRIELLNKTISTKEYKEKISKTFKSKEYLLKVCKTYIITTPIGEKIIVNTGLSRWCKENNINRHTIQNYINKDKFYNGYKIERLKEKE